MPHQDGCNDDVIWAGHEFKPEEVDRSLMAVSALAGSCRMPRKEWVRVKWKEEQAALKRRAEAMMRIEGDPVGAVDKLNVGVGRLMGRLIEMLEPGDEEVLAWMLEGKMSSQEIGVWSGYGGVKVHRLLRERFVLERARLKEEAGPAGYKGKTLPTWLKRAVWIVKHLRECPDRLRDPVYLATWGKGFEAAIKELPEATRIP